MDDFSSEIPNPSGAGTSVEQYANIKKRARIDKWMEAIIWVGAGWLFLLGPVVRMIVDPFHAFYIFADSGGNLALAILIWTFPVLYSQIFGSLPIETVRANVAARKTKSLNDIGLGRIHAGGDVVINLNDAATAAGAIEAQVDLVRINSLKSTELLANYAISSDLISKKIYARAGVYLLVGVIISFIGLGVFYIRSRDIPLNSSIIEHGLYLIPSFGVLFFVEFVALFFLRQYRSAMDEFRYFESIKRYREETLVVLKMIAETNKDINLKDILKMINVYSGSEKLTRNQTTEFLETRKLQKDEIVLFEKILDFMSFLKTTNPHKDEVGKRAGKSEEP